MALTEMRVKQAKPREKAFKLADSDGLYLLITPSGAKYWRFKYRFAGKEKLLALGVYDDISLAEARSKRDKARNQLAHDVDPGLVKQELKRAKKLVTENSFEAIAREWYSTFKSKWTKKHAERISRQLENDVFPWLGNKPITEITAPELLKTLRRIEQRGAIETAHRTQQVCGQVFRFAIVTGRAERDISSDLRGALPPKRKKHHASITDAKAIGALMRAIDGYHGHFITKCAMKLAPLVFVRPGELRNAEWSEISIENAEWRIPANKMKMRAMHIVPLSKQAISILHELHPLTGTGKYVFPCIRSSNRPMSENTVNAGLRRLGYTNDEMTGHGFRSMASTLLNENGWNRDAIERQLAHAERDNIRAAYNYADYLAERRTMMQWWSDYLEKLKAKNTVIELSKIA